jgi:hypothetical protein
MTANTVTTTNEHPPFVTTGSGVGPSFVTTYECIIGWKAVLITWDAEFGYIPDTTAYFAHPTEDVAIEDAKQWAEAEGIEYRPR